MRFTIILALLLGVCFASTAQCPVVGITAEGQDLSNWSVSSSYNSQSRELYVSGTFDQETLDFDGNPIEAIAFDDFLISDLYLMKLTADMQVDWLRPAGKSRNIPTSSRLRATDDGVIAAFQFTDTVIFDSQQFIIEDGGFQENALFMKINQQGDVEWIHRLHELGTSQVNAIDIDEYGIIYIVGTYTEQLSIQGQLLTATDPQVTDGEMFIAKFRPDGDLIWLKHLGGGEGNDKAYSLSCSDNGLFVAGFFSGDLSVGTFNYTFNSVQDGFVASLDTTGDVQWSVHLDGSTSVRNEEVIAFKDGCIVSGHFRGSLDVGSNTESTLSINSATNVSDFFVLRLDGNGIGLWLRNIGGNEVERMLRLESVNDDLFMISGSTASSFSIDGLSYVNHASLQGGENGVVLLLDSAGIVQCLSDMPSSQGSSTLVEHLEGDTIALVGGFVEDLSIQNQSLNIDGTSSVVVKQCFGCVELIRLDVPVPEESSDGLLVYPNPTTNYLNINLPPNQKANAIGMLDMLGREVLRQPFTTQLDISQLPEGNYVLVVETEEGVLRERVVVE